jgi:hypothetical protein
MAEYVFWYSEETVKKGFFTADTLEEARELLASATFGPMDLEDLPNFSCKDKDYELHVNGETLEEVN